MVLVFGLAIGTAARPPSATEAALLPSTGWAPSRSRAVRPGPVRGAKRVACGGAGSNGEGRVAPAAVPAPVSPAAKAHVAVTAARMPPRTGRRTRDRDLIHTLLHRRFVVPRGARPGLTAGSGRLCRPGPGPGPGPDGLPVRAPLVDRCQGQVVAGDRPAVAAERPGRRAVRASEIVVAERAGGPASTGRGAAVCSLRAPWRHPGRS